MHATTMTSDANRKRTDLLIDCTDEFKDERVFNVPTSGIQSAIMKKKLATLDSNCNQHDDVQSSSSVVKMQRSPHRSVRIRLEERARARANELALEKENVEKSATSKTSFSSSPMNLKDKSMKKLTSFPALSLNHMEHADEEDMTISEPISCNPLNEAFSEKQCQVFTNWLNHIFKPMTDLQLEFFNATDSSSNIANLPKITAQSQKLEKARLNANTMFHSPEFLYIRTTLAAEIARDSLSIRTDRDVFADIGLRNQMIDLLLSYSPSWLRLGLETIFQEKISLEDLLEKFNNQCQSRQSLGLLTLDTQKPSIRKLFRKFISDRVLNDPYIHFKYTAGKCIIPSGKFEVEYKKELYQTALKRIISLVIFLNHAKINNAVEAYPVLFNKDSKVKSTRDVFRILSLDYLRGEGNLFKHLAGLGITSLYEQNYIDEMDFSVRNLAVDLRDGVRLVKLASILCGDNENTIFSKMRVPAHSRLQKLHNVEMALSVFRELGIPKMRNIQARHIVDGHRVKVLELLWLIMIHFKMPSLVSPRILGGTINATYTDGGDELCQILLHLTQSICKAHERSIDNFSTSFQDGKVLCLVIHYFFPSLISLDDIRPTRMDLSFPITENSSLDDQAICNEHHNRSLVLKFTREMGGFPEIFSNCESFAFKDEKSIIIFLAYLFSYVNQSSLIDLRASKICGSQSQNRYLFRSESHDVRCIAASIIQSKFRSWQSRLNSVDSCLRSEKSCLKTEAHSVNDCHDNDADDNRLISSTATLKADKAATIIQRKVRGYIARRSIEYSLDIQVATIIQSVYRGWKARKAYVQSQMGIVKIQKAWRLSQHREQCLMIRVIHISATKIQSCYRCWKVFSMFRNFKAHVVTLQSCFRRYRDLNQYKRRQVKKVTLRNLEMTIASKTIQRMYRAWKLRSSAKVIQKIWRGFVARIQFNYHLSDIVFIQSLVRKRCACKQVSRMKQQLIFHSCQQIQCVWRGYTSRKKLLDLNHHVSTIQSGFRNYRQDTPQRQINFSRSCFAAKMIQRFYRSRSSVHRLIRAAVLIQTCWRGFINRIDFYIRRISAIRIQFVVRRFQRFQKFHQNQTQLVASSVRIQSVLRGYIARRTFTFIKTSIIRQVSAIRIQTIIRRFLQFQNHWQLVASCVRIQSIFRGYIARRTFTLMKTSITRQVSVIRVPTMVRRDLRIKNQRQLDASCVRIQSIFRGYIARRRFTFIKMSTIYIQKLVRGIAVRQLSSRSVQLAARRISAVVKCSDSSSHRMTLGEKAKQSLEVLTRSELFKLTELAVALRTLEMVTRLSKECCIAFLQNKGYDALCTFMESCNRSLPHVNLINIGLHIISNLSNMTDATDLFARTSFFDFLLDILHMFRDKDSIFCSASLLIRQFAQSDIGYKKILSDRSESIKRLHGIVKLNSKRLTVKHGEASLLRQGLEALDDVLSLIIVPEKFRRKVIS